MICANPKTFVAANVGRGVGGATLITIVWVLAWAYFTHPQTIGLTLAAVGLGLCPVGFTYLVAFSIAHCIGYFLSAKQALTKILISIFLPSLMPAIVLHSVEDWPLYALGFVPGAVVGSLIAFWKPDDSADEIVGVESRREPTF